MNVPRTAAQQVPPAALGVSGTLPPGYHTSGCRDWYSVHQTGGASPTNCRHPVSAPVSPHPTTVLLVTRSAAYSHPAGHGWRPGHCDGSCPCGFSHCSLSVSLIFLPITDIVLVCAHMHSHRLIKSAVCCRHCNACPHCHCHTTSWPFRPFETMLEAGARHLCALKLM